MNGMKKSLILLVTLAGLAGCSTQAANTAGTSNQDNTETTASKQEKDETKATETKASESPTAEETKEGAATTTPTSTSVPVPEIKTVENDTKAGKPMEEVKDGYFYDTETVRKWLDEGKKAANYPKDEKIVFLTFDDGPSTKVTPEVLDVLKKNDVPATFFYFTQGDLSSRADIVKRTKEEGHSIAIHTASHDYEELYPGRVPDVDSVVSDMEQAKDNVRAILGDDFDTHVYRFPGGAMSWRGSKEAKKALKKTKNALKEAGVEYLDWNTMTGDSDLNNKDKSPKGLVKFLIKQTKSADGYIMVVLMHDANHSVNTPKALQGVIDYYKQEGYTFGALK